MGINFRNKKKKVFTSYFKEKEENIFGNKSYKEPQNPSKEHNTYQFSQSWPS